MKKGGFTLIELIVVITILAILGTIAFISFKGYTSDARDSKTVTDIAGIHGTLAILKATEGILPMPDNASTVKGGTVTISYEGEVGTNVKAKIKASSDMKTSTGENYKYAVTKDQKDFTVVGFLEKEQARLSTKATADSNTDIKYFKGGDVLTVINSNNDFYNADITALNAGDEAYLGEEKLIAPANNVLLKSCGQIKKLGLDSGSKNYNIDLKGASKTVYCDMDTDGGGWTVIGKNDVAGTHYSHAPGFYDNGEMPSPTSLGSISLFDFNDEIMNGSTKFAFKDVNDGSFVTFKMLHLGRIKDAPDSYTKKEGDMGLHFLKGEVKETSWMYNACAVNPSQNPGGAGDFLHNVVPADYAGYPQYGRYGHTWYGGAGYSDFRGFEMANNGGHECSYGKYGLQRYNPSTYTSGDIMFMFK